MTEQQPQQPAKPPQTQWGGQSPPGGWGPPPPGYPPQGPQPPNKRKKWPWVVLGVLVLVVGGGIAIIATAASSVNHEINKTVTVNYKVTGSAESVTVTYTSWNDGTSSTSQKKVTLPWTQVETSSGLFSSGTLTVSVDPSGGDATCSVSVDGETPKTAVASGAFSSATCSAS